MQTEIYAQKLVGHRNEKQNHRNVSAERSSLSSFKHILHAAQGQPHYGKETRWTDLISHSCSYSKCGISLETEIERSQLNALGYFCRRAVYSSIFTTFGGYSSIGGVAHVHRPDTSLWRHPGWAPQRTTLITYGCRLRESLSKERQRRISACQQQKKKSPETWMKHLENYCSLTAFTACYPGWVITGCRGNGCFPPLLISVGCAKVPWKQELHR